MPAVKLKLLCVAALSVFGFCVIVVQNRTVKKQEHVVIPETDYHAHQHRVILSSSAKGVTPLSVRLTSPTESPTAVKAFDESTVDLIHYQKDNETSDVYIHSHQNLYKTTIRADPQCSSNTILLVAVISSPKSFQHRSVYRSTVLWPITSGCLNDTKHIFLVGRPHDDEAQAKLEKESQQHHDIVQGDFVDSYGNLTIKSLFLLKWASENCQTARYVFKLDDDVYAVLEDIRFNLKMKHGEFAKYTILGSIFDGAVPIHDTSNKWFVRNFNESVFPRYVSGTAYIVSGPLLRPLFQEGVNLPFVRLEDVFVTGLAARATNLSIDYKAAPGFEYMQTGTTNLARTNFHTQKTIHGLGTEHLAFLHKKFVSSVQTVC